MSNFFCPTCMKPICDSPGGIPSGCIHFPIKKQTNKDPTVDMLMNMFGMK